MRRGTTPTLTFRPKVKVDGELQPLDLSVYKTVILTFKDECVELDIYKDRLAFGDGIVAVTLTQEETLAFDGLAEVQFRVYDEGVAKASDVGNVDFKRILKEGVIE